MEPLDRTLSALADPNRRSMLERLSRGPATVTELAGPAGISLPGALKHVRILEEANLVVTQKKGRTRECRVRPEQLGEVQLWIERYRAGWQRRLDRLEAVIAERKGGPR
jgi:DNA-binding transcriptional ArsR family regulator